MHSFVIHRHGINYLLVGVTLLFGSQLTLEKTVFSDEAKGTVEGYGVAEHVQVLADDTFEGREGGRRGWASCRKLYRGTNEPVRAYTGRFGWKLFSTIYNTIWNASEYLGHDSW